MAGRRLICPGCHGKHPEPAPDLVPPTPGALTELICPWCDELVHVTRTKLGQAVIAPRELWAGRPPAAVK